MTYGKEGVTGSVSQPLMDKICEIDLFGQNFIKVITKQLPNIRLFSKGPILYIDE